MSNFFKRLFCNHIYHGFRFYRSIYGDEINLLGCRTILVCRNCGKKFKHINLITNDEVLKINNAIQKEIL